MICILPGTHLLLRLSLINKNFSVFVLYNTTLKLVTVIGTFEIFVCICYLKHLKEAQKKVNLVNPGKHQFFCSSNFISQFYFLMKSKNCIDIY